MLESAKFNMSRSWWEAESQAGGGCVGISIALEKGLPVIFKWKWESAFLHGSDIKERWMSHAELLRRVKYQISIDRVFIFDIDNIRSAKRIGCDMSIEQVLKFYWWSGVGVECLYSDCLWMHR
jgi:hypothetical protein